MTPTNFWRATFAALVTFITWQTLTPDPDTTEPSIAIARWLAEMIFHNSALADKVAHFCAYAALGGSAAFANFTIFGKRWPVVGALVLYGAMLESAQGLGGVRAPELIDAAANGLGVIASYPIALLVEKLFSRRQASA